MFEQLRRYFLWATLLLVPIGLTACGNSGPAVLQSAPSTLTGHSQQSSSSACTTPPVQAVQVTANSLTVSVSGTASFVACAQFAGNFTIAASPSGIVSVPSNITPVVDQSNGIKLATITVTGLAPGTATITVTDKKGNTATVTATVISPWVAYLSQGTSGIEIVTAGGDVLKTLPIDSNALALDDAGNIYNLQLTVPGGGNAALQRYAPGSTTPNATYQSAPSAVGVEASGLGELADESFTCGQTSCTLGMDVWNPGAAGGAPNYTLTATQFCSPDYDVDHDGTIYLPQYANGVFSYAVYPPGSATPSRTIPETIVPADQQANFCPNYMAVGPDGTLYVTEYTFVQPDPLAGLYIYSPNGTEKFVQTTSDGNGPGPEGVDVDAAGNIYVANDNSGVVLSTCATGCTMQSDSLHDVEVFAPGGTSVLRHITGNIDPIPIAVAPDGTLFIASYGFNCCGVSAVNGTFTVPPGGTALTQIAPQGEGQIVLYNGAQERTPMIVRHTSSYSGGAAAAHAGGAAFLRYLRMTHRIP